MSVVLSRVGVTGARNSAPQGEVSGLLRGTPPAVYDTSCGESLESDEGALAHCNSSALCVPLEDPGETVPMLRNSAVGCYRRQACTLPGYGDEGIRSPTLRGAQLTPTAPTAADPFAP